MQQTTPTTKIEPLRKPFTDMPDPDVMLASLSEEQLRRLVAKEYIRIVAT